VRSVLACALVLQVCLVVAISNTERPVRPVLTVQLVAIAVSLVVLLALRQAAISRRSLGLLLIGGCAVLQLGALLGPPSSSDDDYRYAWDAKVQLAGIDPYRYAPSEQALTELRDGFTFPDQAVCSHQVMVDGCTQINRATVHTIYPPVAQLAFDAVRLASFGGRGGHLPMQLAGALGVLATTALLIKAANQRSRALWPVAIWAWSPIVAIEATNNAHIEWLAVVLSIAGLLMLRKGKPLRAGALIGAAIAAKLYPGLLLVTAGRRPVRVVCAAAGLVLVGYLPHLFAVGWGVFGYLPDYLVEESYRSGHRYALFDLLVGRTAAAYLAPTVLIAGLGWLWWHADPRRPEQTALTAMGLFVLVTTPEYPWYALILIALAAMAERPEWLWIAFAPGLRYYAPDVGWSQTAVLLAGYGVGVLVLLAVTAGRRSARRPAQPEWADATAAPGPPSRLPG
jgi:alpha-1,2-mannosyltransferase